MKKHLKLIIESLLIMVFALAFVLVCPERVFCQTVESGSCGKNLQWEVDSDNVLIISGSGAMYDYGQDPAPWNDKRLEITDIILEEGIEHIGDYAFYQCRNVERIYLPDTVTEIGGGAFSGCRKLKAVELPGTVNKIGELAFEGCSMMAELELPEGLRALSDGVFSGCVKLKKVVMPESTSEIGSRAFADCISLGQINIPRSVRAIGSGAFSNCSSLTRVKIQCSVPAILTDAFAGYSGEIYYPVNNEYWDENARKLWCPSATWIPSEEEEVDGSFVGTGFIGDKAYWQLDENGELSIYGSGTLPDFDPGLNKKLPWESYKDSVKRVTVKGVSNIGNYMFSGYSNLESVSIRNSVKEIGRCAFADSSQLETVVLSEQLKTVGISAFENCISLREIEMPASVNVWSRKLLKGCIRLVSVEVPDGVSSIGDNALEGCTGLKEVKLPEGLNEIGAGAFAGDLSLKRLRIPGKVSYMGSNVISNCRSLDVIIMKCRPVSKFQNPIDGFDGTIYYNGNLAGWSKTTRERWAEEANWIDNSSLSFDASAYTIMNDEKTQASTEFTEYAFESVIQEIKNVEPEEFIIDAKPAGDFENVKTAEIKVPAELAQAIASVSGKLTVQLADGAYSMDSVSLKGLLKSGCRYIIIRLTDLSDYDASIETYYNVDVIVRTDQDERHITRLDGSAETTIPVMYTVGASLFAYTDYEGQSYSASSYMIRDGLAVIGSSYVGNGGTQGKDWKNASMTLKKRKFTYSGRSKDPGVRVFIKLTNGGSLTLKEGLHYSLNRSEWVKVGTRSVKAKPLRNGDISNAKSRGSISSSIRINPGSASVSVTTEAKKITVKMSRPVSATGAKYYRVYYRKSGASGWTACSGTSKQTKTITGLKVNSKYAVKVRAYTGTYLGALSGQKSSGYVKPGKINSPYVSKISVSSSRSNVYMKSPASYFTGVKYTAVYYKAATGKWAPVTGFKQHSRSRISFADGKAGRKYTVNIKVSGYFHGKKYTSAYKKISYVAR